MLPQGQTGTALPLHECCLFRLGVHHGELWCQAKLAEWLRTHKLSRVLLTVPPLPNAGGGRIPTYTRRDGVGPTAVTGKVRNLSPWVHVTWRMISRSPHSPIIRSRRNLNPLRIWVV